MAKKKNMGVLPQVFIGILGGMGALIVVSVGIGVVVAPFYFADQIECSGDDRCEANVNLWRQVTTVAILFGSAGIPLMFWMRSQR